MRIIRICCAGKKKRQRVKLALAQYAQFLWPNPARGRSLPCVGISIDNPTVLKYPSFTVYPDSRAVGILMLAQIPVGTERASRVTHVNCRAKGQKFGCCVFHNRLLKFTKCATWSGLRSMRVSYCCVLRVSYSALYLQNSSAVITLQPGL